MSSTAREKQRQRRDAVIDSLASLGGTADWLTMGKRGHNISTITSCVAHRLIKQRSPTGPRVFDLTVDGWALYGMLRGGKQ